MTTTLMMKILRTNKFLGDRMAHGISKSPPSTCQEPFLEIFFYSCESSLGLLSFLDAFAFILKCQELKLGRILENQLPASYGAFFLNETFLLRATCPEMKEGTFTHNITIVETQIVKTNVCPIISINALYAATTSLLVISIDPRYYPITIWLMIKCFS